MHTMDNTPEDESDTLLCGSIDKSTRSLQLLIDAQRDFKQLLVLDRCENPEGMGKMKKNVEELKKLISELEVNVFKDAQKFTVEKRQNKGRKVDSGIASRDSTVLPWLEEDTHINEGDQETSPKTAASSALNPQRHCSVCHSSSQSTDWTDLRLEELKSTSLNDSNSDETNNTFDERARRYKNEENFLKTHATAISGHRQDGHQKSNRTETGQIMTEDLNFHNGESNA